MAKNEHTDLMDDEFGMGGDDFFGDSADDTRKNKRTRGPIRSVALNMGKGAVSHFKSESFIRNTLVKALPEGYDTAVSTAFDARDSVSQLYNKAYREFQKDSGSMRQLMRRVIPKVQKVTPGFILRKMESFADGGTRSGGGSNYDEDSIKAALAELGAERENEHRSDRAEAKAKDQLNIEISNDRFKQEMASQRAVVTLLSKQLSFSDNFHSRYMRKSLEVQYRQYYTQRDMLKLHTAEMSATRRLLEAVVHNTALSDQSKISRSQKFSKTARGMLSGAMQQAGSEFNRRYFKSIGERLHGSVSNVIQGMSMGADAANMMAETSDMARQMGMDPTADMQKGIGASISAGIGRHLGQLFRAGFSRQGRVSQTGAWLGRMAGNLPGTIQDWASSPTTRDGFLGQLEDMVKNVAGRFTPNRLVQEKFIHQATDPGLFTRKAQRSVEEIIPGYLSRILNELTITRTGIVDGPKVQWDDDRGRFVRETDKERKDFIHSQLVNHPSVRYGREAASRFVDTLTPDANLSPELRSAMERQVHRDVVDNRPFNVARWMRGRDLTEISPELIRELRSAMSRSYRGPNGQVDQTIIADMTRRYNALQSSIADITPMLKARTALGQGDVLDELGWTQQRDGNSLINMPGYTRNMSVGSNAPMRRSAPAPKGFDYDSYTVQAALQASDRPTNLYDPKDMNKPVIERFKVITGAYNDPTDHRSIMTMHGLVNGAADPVTNKIIATADKMAKLVTASGVPYPEYVATMKGTGSPLARAKARITKHVVNAARWVDDTLEDTAARVPRSRAARRYRRSAAAEEMRKARREADEQYPDEAPLPESGMVPAGEVDHEPDRKSPYARATDAAFARYSDTLTSVGRKLAEYADRIQAKVSMDRRNVESRRVEEEYRKSSSQTASPSGDTAAGRAPGPRAEAAPVHQSPAARPGLDNANVLRQSDGRMLSVVSDFRTRAVRRLNDIRYLLMKMSRTGVGGGSLFGSARGGKRKRGAKGETQEPTTLSQDIFRFLKSAASTAGTVGRGYFSAVRGLFGAPVAGVKYAGRMAGSILDAITQKKENHMGSEPEDVYCDGKKILTKGGMIMGDYFNAKGKPIKRPKDIKGPVYDAEGNTLITEEQFRKGLTDRQGKSIVGRVLGGLVTGVGALGKAYLQYLKVPGAIISGGARVLKSLTAKPETVEDVYLAGNLETPVMKLSGFRDGHYIDRRTRKKIKCVEDIKGAVMDISTNPPTEVIGDDDVKNMVNYQGKKFKVRQAILSSLAQKALGTAGMLGRGYLGAIGAIAKGSMSAMSLPFKAMSHLFGGIGWGGGSLKNLKFSDEGTHSRLDRLIEIMENGGIASPGSSRKAARRAQRAADAVKRGSKKAARAAKKAAGVAGTAAAAGASTAADAASSAADYASNVVSNAKDMAGDAAKSAKDWLNGKINQHLGGIGGTRDWVRAAGDAYRKARGKAESTDVGQRASTVASSVRDQINAHVRGYDIRHVEEWTPIEPSSPMKVPPKPTTASILGGMFQRARHAVTGHADESSPVLESIRNGIDKLNATQTNEFNWRKLKDRIDPRKLFYNNARLANAKEAATQRAIELKQKAQAAYQAARNRVGAGAAAAGAAAADTDADASSPFAGLKDKAQSAWDWLKNRRKKAGGVEGAAEEAEKLAGKGRFGRLAGIARTGLGGLGKAAGAYGLGAGAGYLLDGASQAAGRDTLTGHVLSGAGMLAKGAGDIAAMGSALEMFGIGGGGMAALGTVGSAIGTGAAAVASGLGAVLASPVALTAMGVAGAGYGIYRGIKGLVHYVKLKHAGPLAKYRMAQYGIDMNKSVWPAQKIFQLEGLINDAVSFSGGSGSIDPKKVDMKALMDLFGLNDHWYSGWFTSKATKNEHKKAFARWFKMRFEPIYLNWRQELMSLSKGTGLEQIDDKLTDVQKKTLADAMHTRNTQYMRVLASPFQGDGLSATPPAIEAAYHAVIASLKLRKDADKPEVKAGQGIVARAAKAAGAGVAAGLGIRSAMAADSVNTTMTQVPGLSNTAKPSGTKIKASADVPKYAVMGNKIGALQAVRYKTYGLSELTPEKVKAVFILENAVFDDIVYSGSMQATFDGSIDNYFNTYASYFGVSITDKKAKMRWYAWFQHRFIPTVLQFATISKRENKNIDPRDADQYMGPQHQLDVATITAAALYRQGKSTASVWTFTDSPYDDKPLNTSSKIIEPNLQALRDEVTALNTKMKEQQAKLKAAGDNGSKIVNGSSYTGNGSNASTSSAPSGPPKLPAGMEAGSQAAQAWLANGGKTPVGQPVSQPGHGTGGDITKLPVPQGAGFEAMKPLLEQAAAMAGVDPKLLATFAGIESSFNPEAHASKGSASGLFQFINSTWKSMLSEFAGKYGINPNTPATDPRAAALLGAEYIKKNQKFLTKALGRAPTDTELYAAHFLGTGGADTMIKAPNSAYAASILPSAAGANRSLFFRGGVPLTKASLMAELNAKVNRYRSQVSSMVATAPTASVKDAVAKVSSSLSSTAPAAGAAATAQAAAGSSSTPADSRATALADAQAASRARQTAAAAAAAASAKTQQQHLARIGGHAQRQTELQGKMASLLEKIEGHASRANDLAEANAQTPAPAVETPTSTNEAPASVNRPSAPMGSPPVPMSRLW